MPSPTLQSQETRDQVAEETLEKFRAYRITRSAALRDEIICTHLPLAYSVAHRYSNHGEPLADIIQEGSIGLMKAVDYFDPDRGVRFSTYACHLIVSQILHYLRDCGHLIRQPAWVQELNSKITRAIQQLTQTLGREPSVAEIGQALNLTTESVQEVLAARELSHVVSLTVPRDESDDSPLLLIDKAKIHQQHYRTLSLPIEDRIVLQEAINSLKGLERRVLRLFFFGNLTLAEIASKLSITTPRSAYLLRSSINKLKDDLEEQRLQEAQLLHDATAPPATTSIPIYDKQTGLYSGDYFRARLAEETSRPRGTVGRFVLLLVQFVLPAQGREQLLPHIGRLVYHTLSTTYLTAHLGDGRFGLLLLNNVLPISKITEQLVVQLTTALAASDEASAVAFSLGSAEYPDDGAIPDKLFKRAERALNLRVGTTPTGRQLTTKKMEKFSV